MHTPRRARSRIGAYILLLIAGCAPAIDTTLLNGPYPPTPAEQPILRFSSKLPECPFDEVAVLAGFESPLGSLEATLKAMEDRTRALGGDAIVRLTRIEKGGESEKSGYTGTAIRFSRADCHT